ncbi:hypothetical protein CcCBS67573_g10318 [Chytriomyces confervae]|uniref:Uncharacterized protein n=1 Tax=Chytriomyces confervae TaxID=246404 RepID=A0A507D4K8_9FUNG|nr:hypothetical protein CcCBS67573_g10318 [Chytriomyces confervae]
MGLCSIHLHSTMELHTR